MLDFLWFYLTMTGLTLLGAISAYLYQKDIDHEIEKWCARVALTCLLWPVWLAFGICLGIQNLWNSATYKRYK